MLRDDNINEEQTIWPLMLLLLFSCSLVSDSLQPNGLQHVRLLKLMSIELVMPSNHLTLWHPLLLQWIGSSIRWLKYWCFSFSISPSSEYSGLISMLSKGLSRVFSSTTVQKQQFFGAHHSLWSNSHFRTWLLEKP